MPNWINIYQDNYHQVTLGRKLKPINILEVYTSRVKRNISHWWKAVHDIYHCQTESWGAFFSNWREVNHHNTEGGGGTTSHISFCYFPLSFLTDLYLGLHKLACKEQSTKGVHIQLGSLLQQMKNSQSMFHMALATPSPVVKTMGYH